MSRAARAIAVGALLGLVAAACSSATTADSGLTSTTEPLTTTEAPIVELTTQAPVTTTTTEAGPVVYRGTDDPPDPPPVEALDERPFADQIKVFALGGTIHAVRGYRSDPGYLQLFRFDSEEEGWLELPPVQVAQGQPLHLDTSGGTLRASLVGPLSVADGTRTYLTQDLVNWIEVGTGSFAGAPDGFTSSVIPVRNSPFLMEFGPTGDGASQVKQLVRFDGTGFVRTPVPHEFNWYGGVSGGVLTTDVGDPARGQFSADGASWRSATLTATGFQTPSALLMARTNGEWMYVPEVVEGALLLHVSDDLGRTWTTSALSPIQGVGSVLLASGPAGVALATGAPDAVIAFSTNGRTFEVVAEVEALDPGDARGPIRTLAVGADHLAYSVDEWGVLPVVLPLG